MHTASAACAQSPPTDSAQAATVLREGASAAIAAPADSPQRIVLLRRIAAAQVKLADDKGALATSAALGNWRFEVRTDIGCRLLEERRFDDAYRFAASAPGSARDWELAHLAAQLAYPPFSRRGRNLDTVDTAALVRRAFSTVREVRLAEARVDAYLAIAYTARMRRKDSVTTVNATYAAKSALQSVRDAAFVLSRRVPIAGHLAAEGRVDEAIDMIRSMPLADRLDAIWFAGEDLNRHPRVRALIRAQVALVPAVRDPNVRAHLAWQLYWALKYAGDSAEASAVSKRYPPVDPSTGQPWISDRSPADDVESLVRAARLGAALDAVERIADPMRVGYRARAYLELVEAASGQNRDTIHLTLQRASADARSTSLGDTLHDRLLTEVASAQLSRGFHDDGLETLGFVRTADFAVDALGAIANPPTRAVLSARDRLAIIARASSPEARASAVAALIERSFTEGAPPSDDAALLTALADSLPQGSAREQAQVAVALRALTLNDTATARARLVRLLPTYQPSVAPPSFFRREPRNPLLAVLVRIRADDDVLRWAHAIRDPLARGVALLVIGEALLARAGIGRTTWMSNGPDMCRDEF